jgi:hypothetical protein
LSTKGPSNLYALSERINYQYASSFFEKKLEAHALRHGTFEMKLPKKEYISKAIEFANRIDKFNNQSFVDLGGSTYKRNKITKEFIIINNRGIVITYFKMSSDKKWQKLNEKQSRKR